ncbi:response regulator [Dokdonia ponticola]|uniref:Response regulator n=1 Tax=Dokdonia ponticola TaxID=2041041 RepID=A0ABV9I3Q8_9FLAO
MGNISILIVDDDINKITAIISTIKSNVNDVLSINQASNVQEAIEYLQKKEFHLLITDLKMPLRHDDLPNDSGGQSLVKNLYRRKNKTNVPMFIIGLTQFPELEKDLKNVWKVWHFEASEEYWKVALRDLIFHISLVKSRINVEKIETIFVEGITDKQIIETVMLLYYPNKLDSVYIDAIKYGGGASWVERQLFIWAKSLTTKINDKLYVKSIGLFDDDESGITSINKLRKSIDVNSAEGKTFHIKKSCYKYSPIIKSIKNKGITFPTVIEDLISEGLWDYSHKQGWLTPRNLDSLVIDKDKIEKINKEFNINNLKELGFTNSESLLILFKIKDDYKKKFSMHIKKTKREYLYPIKYMVEDFFDTLNIKYTKVEK